VWNSGLQVLLRALSQCFRHLHRSMRRLPIGNFFGKKLMIESFDAKLLCIIPLYRTLST